MSLCEQIKEYKYSGRTTWNGEPWRITSEAAEPSTGVSQQCTLDNGGDIITVTDTTDDARKEDSTCRKGLQLMEPSLAEARREVNSELTCQVPSIPGQGRTEVLAPGTALGQEPHTPERTQELRYRSFSIVQNPYLCTTYGHQRWSETWNDTRGDKRMDDIAQGYQQWIMPEPRNKLDDLAQLHSLQRGKTHYSTTNNGRIPAPRHVVKLKFTKTNEDYAEAVQYSQHFGRIH